MKCVITGESAVSAVESVAGRFAQGAGIGPTACVGIVVNNKQGRKEMTREEITDAFKASVEAVKGAKEAGVTFTNEDGVILSIMQVMIQARAQELEKEAEAKPQIALARPSFGGFDANA